ncbi:MAG: hypothetical protein WCD00_05130 [Desulfuromonadaceae bacterium]
MSQVRSLETMMISSRRKRIGVALGVLLLAVLGWFFWPFVAGPGQMQSFCSSLAVGTSLAQVQTQATQHGYRVSSLIEGRAFVHDSASFGRFTCNLEFGSDGLVSSVYSFND